MTISHLPTTFRGIRRIKHIAQVFIRLGFYDLVMRANIPGISQAVATYEQESAGSEHGKKFTAAQRLRLAFEELGPTFIKFGQMLSLEPDIIPIEYVEEFKKLQDNVPPFSFAEVEAIIEEEFGEKPDKVFKSIDSTPLAAASVAQVHKGQLFSGEIVAIKVQRPYIEEVVREDLKILMRIARSLEKRIDNMILLNPVAIINEFKNFISKELDFTNEAANIDRFTSNFADDDTLVLPEVYWDYTTPRVLVMSHLDGFSMIDLKKIKEAGLDPDTVSRTGLNIFAKQIFEHGFFHGDPHPGNALVMRDGRVGLVDFGIMGFIDREMMRHIANIFVAYSEHDYERLIIVFMNMELINDKTDIKSFKYDLMDVSEPFYGRSLKYIQIKDVFDKVISMAVKYRLRLPRELIMLFKTLIAMEGVGRHISPDSNILEIMKPYASKLLGQTFDPKRLMGDMRHDLFNLANVLKEYPELVHKVLANFAKGNQNVNLTHKVDKLDEIERIYILGSTRMSVSIVIGTAVLAGSWILASDYQHLPVSLPYLGMIEVPITVILGFIGYSVATLLGIWYVFSIFFRSK